MSSPWGGLRRAWANGLSDLLWMLTVLTALYMLALIMDHIRRPADASPVYAPDLQGTLPVDQFNRYKR